MTKHELEVFTKVVDSLEKWERGYAKDNACYKGLDKPGKELIEQAREALSNAERWEPVEFIGSDGAQVSKWEDRWQLWYPEKGMWVEGHYNTPEAAFEAERQLEEKR